MNTYNILVWGLRLAGVGQLFVAIIYFWVRGILGCSNQNLYHRGHRGTQGKHFERTEQLVL